MRLLFGKQGSLAQGALALVIGVLVSLAGAAMSPPEITVACHGLARMACKSKSVPVVLRRCATNEAMPSQHYRVPETPPKVY
jgi:hypothetical protein